MPTIDLFSKSAYDYSLPSELIAQHPCTPRDNSRLMVVEKSTGKISEIPFYAIYDLLRPGDSLVFNDTKVIPARLLGTRRHGGAAELLLTKPNADGSWDALAKPGRKIKDGAVIELGEGFSAEIVETYHDGSRRVKFHCVRAFEECLNQYGKMPLPHYIHRDGEDREDRERYQTVYAANPGAAAAPTAGLHFTEELLNKLANKGITQSKLTLHVGVGTFRPVSTDDIRSHQMHSERFIITPQTAASLNNRASTSIQICVGTTTCRALESAADTAGCVQSGEFDTSIFIYPGYKFKYARAMLTNFHLPCSTLLMLVSAFAGFELIKEAYAKAIEKKFRFYSYGDAMLIM